MGYDVSRLDEIRAEIQSKYSPKGGGYVGPIIYEGKKIAQFYNPKLLIDDIIAENKTKRFTNILNIGTPGTGKSTLAGFIAHEIHTKAPNYHVVWFDKYNLMNFDIVMDRLPNRDVIMIFDDVSLIFKLIRDKTKRYEILSALTEARHPKLGGDRRVIIIANIHYLHSMDKMWRSQGSWKIYTDLSLEEQQNFNHITKSRYKALVNTFSKTSVQMFRKLNFELRLTASADSKVTYETDNPFRVMMCFDNVYLRFFVYTKKSCKICEKKVAILNPGPKVDSNKIFDVLKKHYQNDGIMGLKLALFLTGRSKQYRNRIMYGFNIAKDIITTLNVDLDDLEKTIRKRQNIKDKRAKTPKSNVEKILEELKTQEEISMDVFNEISDDIPDDQEE